MTLTSTTLANTIEGLYEDDIISQSQRDTLMDNIHNVLFILNNTNDGVMMRVLLKICNIIGWHCFPIMI